MQFTDLTVRQASKTLTTAIYSHFQNNKDFWFKDQIQRASMSIMNNIAEGFERNSLKEKKRFYTYAKWSTGEVRSMLFVAEELDYISSSACQDLIQKTYAISKMIYNLIHNSKY